MSNDNGLTEQARLKRNEYMRNWRNENKDKVKAINSRYWEKKTKDIKE